MKKLWVSALALSFLFAGSAAQGAVPSKLPIHGVYSSDLVLTPQPDISAGFSVGKTITVNVGTWDDGVTTAIQWLRDDQPILGETSNSYTVVFGDLSHSMSVQVTGSKPGFTPVTVKTTPLQTMLGTMTLTPLPKILGIVKVGETVTADLGQWDEGVTTKVQWLANGVWINGATSASYTVGPEFSGLPLSLNVIAEKTGYSSFTWTSNPVNVQSGAFTMSSAPTVSGTMQTGQTLTAVPGTWDAGVSFLYQWFREGYQIDGATSRQYTLTSADVGFNLTVRVRGIKSGYTGPDQNSAQRLASLGAMTTRQPKILGTAKVNKVVRASVSAWLSGASIRYFWLLDGKSIPGAYKSSYAITKDQKGHKLSLKVIQNLKGFAAATSTSAAIKVG